MRHQVESAEAEAAPPREKRKPVFSVGVETNAYSGGDFRSAMLAVRVTLPWFNRAAYRADLARAEDLRDATVHDLAAAVGIVFPAYHADHGSAKQRGDFRILRGRGFAKNGQGGGDDPERLGFLQIHSPGGARCSPDSIEAKQEQKRALASRHVADQALIALTGGPLSNSNK